MAIRNVRTIGDEILTKTAKEVKEMTPWIKELIEDMFDTMYEAVGVGLAAPQVTYIMNDLIRAGINVNPDAITIAEAKESILSHFKRNAKA